VCQQIDALPALKRGYPGIQHSIMSGIKHETNESEVSVCDCDDFFICYVIMVTVLTHLHISTSEHTKDCSTLDNRTMSWSLVPCIPSHKAPRAAIPNHGTVDQPNRPVPMPCFTSAPSPKYQPRGQLVQTPLPERLSLPIIIPPKPAATLKALPSPVINVHDDLPDLPCLKKCAFFFRASGVAGN
jgi:hypothetical protein